ncbi:putative DNA-binding domain-containing protein [Mannheimia pernigra]|uniref:DNA-binding domain-containing protein n=1 Tax=Mannheimia pernigra TaxID=111844 RepID=A0ABD7A9F7_9PAST|nr:putative DNA-binding domain-containing protein [Mannheimia pernigra]QLB42844.1 putative DNA-binding domain-containing protein [Mannheimia pernigra]QLB44908.1 putative DNA-binding domain-containing protein [Mannheimia pernigra]
MPLKLVEEHKPSLKEIQAEFTNAIRHNDVKLMSGNISPQRLGVYSRLVRNNTLGFIDRCYVQLPQHLSPEEWLAVKEKFIREGKAHSPFFQDIAGEFLNFCRENGCMPPHLLELMDFENAQLLAEVSMATVPSEFEWDNDTIMQFSGAAELRQYETHFLRSNFKQFEQEPSNVLVWRDAEFGIYHNTLEELDFFLLSSLQEGANSLNGLFEELREFLDQNTNLKAVLQQIWVKWVNADVIYPV